MAKATQNKAPKNVTKDGADKGKVSKTNANLTREERRQRDKDLKDKAKKEVLKSGFHFDDTIPASQFFQNYGSAVKRATLGPLHAHKALRKPPIHWFQGFPASATLGPLHAKANEEPAEQTDAEKRLDAAGTDDMKVDDALVAESDAKDAKELTSAEKTIAAKRKFDEEVAAAAAKKAFEETVETAKAEDAANENTADEKPTTLAIKPTETGAELVPAVTDPWLKREDESKSEWKARKKLLAKAAAAAATPVEQQAPNVMANPTAAPEALVKAMHTETRNGEPPTVNESAAKPPKGERYLTQEELDWWTARGGVVPGFVPVDWTIAKHEEHIATVEAMKNNTDDTKAENDTEQNVVGTEDAPAPDADNTEAPNDTPPAPVEETPAPVVPEEQPSADTPAGAVEDTPQPVQAEVVTKPELVVDNSNVATPAGIQHRGAENQAAAAKFYGAFYNKDNAGELNEAHFWLISAIKADEEGAESKFYMTLANSLKYEQYAFGNRTATSTVLIGQLKSESLFSNRVAPRPSQAKAA